MTYQERLQARKAAMDKAENLVATCEKEKRNMNAAETQDFDAAMAEVTAQSTEIARIDKLNTLKAQLKGVHIPEPGRASKRAPKHFSEEYYESFWGNLGNLRAVEAALYEGSNSAGGYAVPIEVDGTIVPLAPQEFAIRQLATIVPTTNDVKIPIQATRSTAAAKAESTSASDTSHGFTDTTPTLTQKTLSSHMAGGITSVSWEAAQDANLMERLATPDLINAVQVYEEGKFISGAGTTEPEGVVTGADFGVANEDMDLDRILDWIGTLNAEYHSNASFLFHRSTSIAIRKMQLSANLFDPVWTRVGSQDYLYGYPVYYSSSMPTIAQLAKVGVFGDFKRGFVIGDRGGSGINVKILDQPKAVYGLIDVLAYRRTDSLARRSEALKTFVIDSGS